jgi:4-diphosphocytidyl-2-C-methyl-D-erythritol kinase
VELAMRLGSDVAFFLDEGERPPRGAVVMGLGERVERVERSRGEPVLLILPPFGCPTGAVYQAFDRAPTSRVDEARVRALVTEAEERGEIPAGKLFNDLETAACAVEPRLWETLRTLRAKLEPEFSVHVTGSGSTMFCLPGRGMELAAAMVARGCPEVAVMRSWIPGHGGADRPPAA